MMLPQKYCKVQGEFFEVKKRKEKSNEFFEYLKKAGIRHEIEDDKITVRGNVFLSELPISSLPNNLTVGGFLDLEGTAITSLPDNLTVGRDLDLRGTSIISLPDNLTVGRYLYLEGTAITKKQLKKIKKDTSSIKSTLNLDSKLSWQNGKYRKIDGIFCEVLRVLKAVTVVKVGSEISYVVTDGDNYSHGKTIKEAREGLMYKLSSRDTTPYRSWSLDTVITEEQAIKSYRAITGACERGVKYFMSTLGEVPETVRVSDVIEITRYQYSSDLYAAFFSKG